MAAPRPRVAVGLQGPLDQLMVLPPMVRIVTGLLMVGIVLDIGAYSVVLLAITAAVGAPLLLLGLGDRRRQRIAAAERLRAERELPELRALLVAARQQGRSVFSLLRQRGYQSDVVCRWIALECGIVLPRGER
jgi:hypothetical protein